MITEEMGEPEPHNAVGDNVDRDPDQAAATSEIEVPNNETDNGSDDRKNTERAIDWMWYFTLVIAIATCVQGFASCQQWRATQDALQVTRETTIADIRPWVLVGDIAPTQMVAEKEMVVTVPFTNVGKTPAMSLRGRVAISGRPKSEPLHAPPPDATDSVGSSAILGPAQNLHISIKYKALAEDLVPFFRSGEYLVYVFADISYYDVFRIARHSSFCGTWDPETGGFVVCPGLNDAD